MVDGCCCTIGVSQCAGASGMDISTLALHLMALGPGRCGRMGSLRLWGFYKFLTLFFKELFYYGKDVL